MILKQNTFFFGLLSVVDKILKKKTYPLYMNQKCHSVAVSPCIERRLEKYQVGWSPFPQLDSAVLHLTPHRP